MTGATPPALPVTTPLPHRDLDGAFALQQRLVAAICEHLPGELLLRSDVGVVPGLGRPETTARAERVLAAAFGAQDACLVQGAGTGAIRAALSAGPWRESPRRLLLHDAPDYSTTATTFADGQVQPVRVDFGDTERLDAVLSEQDCPGWVYIQHTRQRLSDAFDPMAVVRRCRAHGRRVVVDENYAVVRTPAIGTEHGAAASAFSLFKLLGPEGVGVVLGDADLIGNARAANYSGGGQVQGHQAVRSLQALVTAPLNWARQSQEVYRLAERLRSGAVPGILDAAVANVQDLCVVALLATPSAEEVRRRAAANGAAPYPVGSNSRYEIAPMVYRMSSSTLAAQPELRDWTLRINPMRAGADLVVDILRRSVGS